MRSAPAERTKVKKPFIEEMHVIRAAAVIAVLIVHSTSNALVELSTDSSFYSLYVTLNTIFKFGTPMFLFLSAFVLFYNYWDRDLNRSFFANFYKRRVTYIIIPYAMISIFYFLAKAYLFYGMPDFDDVKQFLFQLATGRAHFHLYFIFVLIQFYLFFPISIVFLKRFDFLMKHLIWIGIVLQWAFVLYNSYELKFPYKGSVMFSYFSFYTAGIFTAYYFDQVKDFFTITKVKLRRPLYALAYAAFYLGALFSIGGHAYSYIMMRKYNDPLDSKWYEFFWHFQNLFIIFLLIQFFTVVYPKLARGLQSFFHLIAGTSFGVYLLHPFFLMIYERFPVSGNVYLYHAQTLGKFLVIWLLPMIAVLILSKLTKYHWIVIGNNGVRKPNKAKHEYTKRNDRSSGQTLQG